MEETKNIKELCVHFNVSVHDMYKRLLKLGNTYGVKILHQQNDEIYIQTELYNRITEYLNNYKGLIPEKRNIVINASETVPIKRGSYIYFLLNNEIIIYIGQTVHLGGRVNEHLKDKSFDEIYYFSVDESVRLFVEALCIQNYSPELNNEFMESEVIVKHVLNQMF